MRIFSRARLFLASAAAILSPAVVAAAPLANVQPDAEAPRGKLSDAARPTAYRLDFTIDPDRPRFSGHDEIDAVVKAPTAKLYLHGRDLNVTRVVARIGNRAVAARYTQVDPTGVARLDFAEPLPAGAVTLAFDYDGAFGENASGLYRVKVDDKYYSWTQFESIDARAAYPSFDEPGFKTPFTISVTTKPGNVVVSNAPQASVARAGAMEKHVFQPTRPLPTYLVAIDTGPFVHTMGSVAPTPQRARPMPLGVVATQPNRDKMGYVMAETPRIVSLLERYFNGPFPFPKLDQIGSPIMPGAMENAGADTYGDGIIFLDPKTATTGDKQAFGMVVAHELSHQWFGDLVTPAWWDDIWLNESFANWMGFRIGNEWRPELKIGVGGLGEGFRAMGTDALIAGRPIHQTIATNGEIDSAFDGITYGKGGQVIAMIAAYMGDDKFRDGVRLHVKRHAYGNATSADFFKSLADAAGDERVVAAMRSFVDQQGVPTLDVRREGGRIVATQSRYAYLGEQPTAQRWTVPFCVRTGTAENRRCALIDGASGSLSAPQGAIMPNAGGTGYYRFTLAPADWQALLGEASSLAPAETIAVTDSAWAQFRAGKAPASLLVQTAAAMVANPYSKAVTDGGERFAGLHTRGLIATEALPGYRRMIGRLYAPTLATLGFDPAAGAYAADTPDRQQLRGKLVELLASEAEDRAVQDKLAAAATRFLAGDKAALDQAFLYPALGVLTARGGVTTAKMMVEKAIGSQDASLRQALLISAADSGRADVARYILSLQDDARLRPFDRLRLVQTLAGTQGTVNIAADWMLDHYDRLAGGTNGIFFASRLPSAFGNVCGVDRAARIDGELGPKIRAANIGVLAFERVVEEVRNCGVLRDAKQAELAAAINGG